MGDMSISVISSLEGFMKTNNKNNLYVKFFPRAQQGYLVSISVRFFLPTAQKDYFVNEIEKKVFSKIREISHNRLLPTNDDLFRFGVLELKASYMYRYCDEEMVKRTLNFIANEMIPMITEENK